MRRRLSALLVPLAALLAGVAVVGLASPGAEECFAQAGADPEVEGRIACPGASGPSATPTPAPLGTSPASCAANPRLRFVGVARRGRGLRFGFGRRGTGPVTVDVFRVSRGRRVLGNRRVARFVRRSNAFTWRGRGRGLGDGLYFVRFRAPGAETRRIALRRRDGRFSLRPDFQARDRCVVLRAFKLERPVFGGRTNRALGISYRLDRAARVTVTVTRAGRTVRRFRTTSDRAGRTYRLRLAAERLRRGDHEVRIAVRPPDAAATTARLTAARL